MKPRTFKQELLETFGRALLLSTCMMVSLIVVLTLLMPYIFNLWAFFGTIVLCTIVSLLLFRLVCKIISKIWKA